MPSRVSQHLENGHSTPALCQEFWIQDVLVHPKAVLAVEDRTEIVARIAERAVEGLGAVITQHVLAAVHIVRIRGDQVTDGGSVSVQVGGDLGGVAAGGVYDELLTDGIPGVLDGVTGEERFLERIGLFEARV